MAVMARETWTDERLDGFKENVNQRFDQVEKRMDERFDHVDREFERVDKRFGQVDKRFDRVDRDIRELRQSVDRLTLLMVAGFLSLAGLIVSAQVFF